MLSFHINFCWQKLVEKVQSHWVLAECFFVALSFHIALIPILWVVGWTLPWPKPPVFTVTIEYELDNSTGAFKPKDVHEYRDPKLNP